MNDNPREGVIRKELIETLHNKDAWNPKLWLPGVMLYYCPICGVTCEGEIRKLIHQTWHEQNNF